MNSINKTKIIFIVTQSEFGGAQRYIFELVSCLNKEKYDILIAAGHGDKELFKKIQNLPITSFQLKHLKRNPNPLEAISSISEMIGLLKKEEPDILFLCSTTAGVLGSFASYLYKSLGAKHKIQTIYRIGGWAFNDPRSWPLNKLILWAEKLTAPFKDKIIVNSEFDYQSAIKLKVCSPDKITKIHNGIDAEKLEFLPRDKAREFLSEKTHKSLNFNFLIGCVANFYRTKGINYLIESIKLLEVKYKPLDVKCIVIGDGKQRPELESLIKKFNLEDKVFLAGRIPDAYKYLKAFDVKKGFPGLF